MEFVTTRRRQGSDDELHDLLTMLLHAKDESGQGRSDEELRDELLTLVATGYETTATALAWGLYWIAADAAVRGRIRDEVAELGSDPDPGEYARLEYLDAVTKEILRIYPIVPFVFRQVVQPFSAAGYTFEPDTILAPCVYLTHHREGLYDRPDSFDPGRFLGRAYSPYEYLPFGGGSRRCIGMNLAIYEMKLIIALIFARFDLESTSQVPLVPVRRSVTMGPSGGGRMVVRHGCS